MSTSAAELVSQAKAQVENLTPEQVADGMIAGAVHAPRGMLEFWADPTSPYHRAELDPGRRTVLYCASGGRSALAAQTLAQLGYANVAHLDGGIKGWAQAGHPVVSPDQA